AVLGPARSCSSALHLLQSSRPDVAILDFKVEDGTCQEVGAKLDAMGVPWALATGYSDNDVGPPNGAAKIITKPFSKADVVRLLSELTGPFAGDVPCRQAG
ncbi:MAG: hypothetical protein M3N26_02865, partial [Pseudomonadota bacterium]|nr:hypothetical protein [Pseudomonadota bacterium]